MIEETTNSNLSIATEEQIEALCAYCKEPIVGGDSWCHTGCRSEAQCSFCGQSELCVRCEVPGCSRVVHPHCSERWSSLGKEFLCDLHTRKGGKPRENSKLLLARQIAHRVSLEPAIVSDVRKLMVDERGQSSCTGSIFWYVLCQQFFPYTQFLPPPRFPLKRHLEFELPDPDLSQSICILQEELEHLQTQNRDIIDPLLFNPLTNPKVSNEDELIIADISNPSLRKIHKEFLNTVGSNESVIKNEQDSVCNVCGDTDYDDDDLIIICGKCEIAVHMKCYGILTVPNGDWFCEPCTEFPGEVLKCALCSMKGGALKRTVNITSEVSEWPNYSYIGIPEEVWCHAFCVTHLDQSSDPLMNIDLNRIDKKKFEMTCQVCLTQAGACLQCQQRRCQASFHPECGKSLFINTRNKTGFEEVEIYCPEHKPLSLSKTIECKKKKTLEEIKVFCSSILQNENKKKHKKTPKIKKSAGKFGLTEMINMFEWTDNYLSSLQAEQSEVFSVKLKKLSGRNTLRNKVDVLRPSKYTLFDPQAILDNKLRFEQKDPHETSQLYAEHIYPLLKQELIIMKEKTTSFKPTKRINNSNKSTPRKIPALGPILTQELYCLCRKPFVSNEPPLHYETEEEFKIRTVNNSMIHCESCDEWYHFVCVGLPFDFKEQYWKCPNC